MATRKQKASRQRRATQHSRRARPALPAEWTSDERWLSWSRDQGLDLQRREQLLDSVAVGLTVLCWRNTVLEDVHAGVERGAHLERLGKDPDDPAVQAEETEARRAYYQSLDADWDALAVVDPDEAVRIGRWLEGRDQGFGIPDDIMMRLNISTALAVREILDDLLPESVTEAGAELPYDRRAVPDHVAATATLLQDPSRVLTVGGTEVVAGEVLADSWDEYAEDVIDKVSRHVMFCDRIGVRRALWYMGLSGVLYASSWFPNPWWARAVDQLQRATANGDLSALFYAPDRADATPLPDNAFWETLLGSPAELNGLQCRWVQSTRIRDCIRAVREDDREVLGPLAAQHRFSSFAALH